MTDGKLEALEGRQSAQRRVLAWLVRELAPGERRRLVAALSEPYPPQDGQEDPGAVPVEGFAGMAAYTAELRAILAGAGDKAAGD
jgi:hypothetical protein